MGLSRFSAGNVRSVPEDDGAFPGAEGDESTDAEAIFPVVSSSSWRLVALASRPQLLILDEPTEGIQPSVIKEMGR